MSPSSRRLWVLSVVFLAGLGVVALHLALLTVAQHEQWLVRSYRNRWTFRDVPTRRGSLLDRHGRVIATDRPSFEVLANYRLFRRSHAVGAAVHGANLLSEASGWYADHFGYRDRSGDPLQAFDALVKVQLDSLRAEHFSHREDAREVARDLRFYTVAVLSACSGQARTDVWSALSRALEEARSDMPVWQVVTGDLKALRETFRARWLELLAMEERLRGQAATRSATGEEAGLIDVLEGWRQQRLRWIGDPENDGAPWSREDWFQPIQDRLPFELAASIRLQQRSHPGLQLTPSVERIYQPLPGREDSGSLAAVVGGVTIWDRKDKTEKLTELVAGAMESFDPTGSLGEASGLLGETAADAARAAMRRYFVSRGRTGSSGTEAALEGDLAGTPGLRWAESDKGAREQMLLSNLQVSPGRDVRLTLDLELQSVLEEVVEEAIADPRPAEDVALVLIDAESGDLLAMAGRPLRVMTTLSDPAKTRMELVNSLAPGLGARRNPDVGSVAKPFMLLEHLAARRSGRAHQPSFEPCPGKVPVAGMMLGCTNGHWQQDPEGALAQSCNVFFFQVAQGLQVEGLHRAYERVGWLEMGDPGTNPAYQRDLPGINYKYLPELKPNRQVLEQQAIGYGVHVSALYVARAYAALATGSLPRVRLVDAGEPEPAMSLDVHAEDLDRVRKGLRDCVLNGTGRNIPWHAPLRIYGKTGTAEIGSEGQNNAWFAGYLERTHPDAPALAFAAVAYFAPDLVHGGDIAGGMVAGLFRRVDESEELQARYLPRAGQR